MLWRESHAAAVAKRKFRHFTQRALGMQADLYVRFSETLERPPKLGDRSQIRRGHDAMELTHSECFGLPVARLITDFDCR